MNNTIEIWKNIGDYDVSNFGRVRSYKYDKNNPRILRPRRVTNGYYAITICEDGKNNQVMIHRLVAKLFVPNPKNMAIVDHVNGNKSDNLSTNLQWISQKDNIQKHFLMDHDPNKCKICKRYNAHIRTLNNIRFE